MDKTTEWKLVPVIPTPEMLAAVDDEVEDKYVARGRAFSAYRAMLAVAPAVQGEPVAWLEGEPSMRGATLSNLTALTRSTRLHLTKPSTSNPVWPLYTAPQPAPDASPLVDALEAACEKLRKDAERLDFIDTEWFSHDDDGELKLYYTSVGPHNDLRAAIDAAMQENNK